VAIVAVTVAGGLLRLVRVRTPSNFVLDEFYTQDACWYLYRSPSLCRTRGEITAVHPPLGKWLIATGIKVFGNSSGGWRIASVVAGTLTITAVYLLGRRLLGSTMAATAASGLLAVDFLHFVMSRTAMLDVFVVMFLVAAFLCLVLDRDRILAPGPATERAPPLGGCRWRYVTGLAIGAAAACKWSAWPFLPLVVGLTLGWEVHRRRSLSSSPARQALRDEWKSLLLAFGLLPIVIYAASFLGTLEGSFLAWPWQERSWIHALVARQAEMVSFHLPLSIQHPYASAAWSWPLLKRPVLFFFRDVPGGGYQVTLALGDPLVWWPSLVAVAYLAARWVRYRRITAPEAVIVSGFVFALAPWLLLGERKEQFLYYLLPAVPFMCLGLSHVVVPVFRGRWRPLVLATSALAVVGAFGYFYPVLTAMPTSRPAWEARVLFRDCAPYALEPQTEPVPPPSGWCWA
jgi:dolichyl-phosphate-mannose-protein mannosyltransferase